MLFCTLTVVVGFAVLATDAHAASLPSGSSLVYMYPDNDSSAVVDGSQNGSGGILSPVSPSTDYTFRIFCPASVSYYNRFRVATYSSYPTVGTTGTYLTRTVYSLTRSGDYLSYSFTTPSDANFILLFLWYYPNNADMIDRYYQYSNPELYSDIDIFTLYYPTSVYPGENVSFHIASNTLTNSRLSVAVRPVGETDTTEIYVGNSTDGSFDFYWAVPSDFPFGGYDIIVSFSDDYQGYSATYPLAILTRPSPAIPPDGELPVSMPDQLPDDDYRIDAGLVEIVGKTYSILPSEFLPMFTITVICLFLGLILRKRGGGG